MHSRRAASLAVAAALIALAAPAGAAAQTTYTVNTLADGIANGGCTTAPNGCTLRGAIGATVAGDIVSVPPGTYVLTMGALVVGNSVSILGAGARTTIISGNGRSRVATISTQGTQATISGVTATGGNGIGGQIGPSGQGGAFHVVANASLALVNSTVAGNTAVGLGGGIYSRGTLGLSGTTVSGNRATGAAAPGQGGGIYQAGGTDPFSIAAIVASTVSGNSATGSGGGIASAGLLQIQRTTIAGNTAAAGSGLFKVAATSGSATAINDTIVAAATGTACAGDTTPITGTHNLSDDASCSFMDTGDIQNAEPLLGGLQNNGGPTDTHALGAASPAIGAANPGSCTGTDQRGVARPQQGTCDIGAFEYVPPPVQPPGLPPPVAGKLVNALPKSGRVRIKLPGSTRFVLLTEGRQLPVGTIVDTRNGRVTLIAAANKTGGTSTADFYDGLFKLLQSRGAKPITTLRLVEKLSCGRGKASAAAKKTKKRKLWGDGKGRFRTKGSYSSATVRGTKWLVQDRCTSTLTRVVRGKVTVRDFVKHKSVIVGAGKRYLARRR